MPVVTNLMTSILNRIVRSVSRADSKNRLQQEWEALTYLQETDEEDNHDTTPPDDECINLNCIWAVEYFTPAHTDKLIENLLKFNRDHPSDMIENQRIDAWINGLHKSPLRGSWINLGVWEPKGRSRKLVGTNRRVDLPESVTYATASISRVSPSIFCLVVCFEFDDDFSKGIENALRRHRNTSTEPYGNGFSFFDPETQKRNDVKQLRSDVSQRIGNWFREHFPGVFSSAFNVTEVPVCEFVTLRTTKPFPDLDADEPPGLRYLDVIGLAADWEAWRHSQVPGLRFSIQQPPRTTPQNYSTLSICEEDCPQAMFNYGGHQGKTALITYMDRFMPSLVSMWAALPLLEGYTEQVGKILNSTEFRIGTREDSVSILRRLHEHLSFLSDLGAVSADLAPKSVSASRAFRFHEPFEPCRPGLENGYATLSESLNEVIEERANWLQVIDQSVRDRLAQLWSVIDATENVRLQKTVSTLTRVIVLLTLVTLMVTIFQSQIAQWVATAASLVGDLIGIR